MATLHLGWKVPNPAASPHPCVCFIFSRKLEDSEIILQEIALKGHGANGIPTPPRNKPVPRLAWFVVSIWCCAATTVRHSPALAQAVQSVDVIFQSRGCPCLERGHTLQLSGVIFRNAQMGFPKPWSRLPNANPEAAVPRGGDMCPKKMLLCVFGCFFSSLAFCSPAAVLSVAATSTDK